MARSFKVYQGEDETPVYDLTEPDSPVHVIWEEIEAGGRAFRGESTTNSIPMRDEQGGTGNELSLPSGVDFVSLSRGSRWEWRENVGDANEVIVAAGRIGPKDYSRGRQKADRARELTMQAGDRNEELTEIIVDDWVRSEELDYVRVEALRATYLDGDPRATTVIADTYIAQTNGVTLPAKTYDGTNPKDILSEIASLANKNFFVTVDDELWYDEWDSSSYPAGLRISDRLEEQNTSGEAAPDIVQPHPTIATPNGDWEMGDDTNWSTFPVEAGDPTGVGGGWYGVADTLSPGVAYEGWIGETFLAGTEYAVTFWTGGVGDDVHIRFGDQGAADFESEMWLGGYTVYPGAVIQTMRWTPTANRTNVTLHFQLGSNWGAPASGTLAVDQVLLTDPGSVMPTFPPKWDVGPASSEDGSELVSGLRLYYGQEGAYVYVNHAGTEAAYWHAERSFYTSDPAISDSTTATVLANAILTRLRFEERTYNVTVGLPLNADQVTLLKPGQLIQIKARAIPDADDEFVVRRIAQLKWTTPRPGLFWAHMQLNRPIKEVPYGIGPKQSHDAIAAHKEGDSHPASAIVITDSGALYSGNDVEAALQEIGAHPGDSSDAHDASAISIVDAGAYFTGTDVEAALQELGAGGGGGSGVTVQDEGTPLATSATTLNFVGAGVTATGAGATKTITIPGGGGASSPTVAGSDAATFSTANGTISTPAETSTGDLLILFAEQGNGFSSITAGWDLYGWTSVANVNGCLATKVATAGDAAGGGSVTAAFGGAFNGELIIVAVTGWRKISGYAWRQASASATTITTSMIAESTEPYTGSGVANAALTVFAGEGDLALYFGAARLSSGTITPSRGSVIEQRTGDTNASSVLASETLASGGPVKVTMTTTSSAQVAGVIIVSG